MRFNNDGQADLLINQDIAPSAYLLGLLSTFNNRYQASANEFFKEVTWKQYFALICIFLFKEPPIITDLADVMNSSHQNVKQILLKLEDKGFVRLVEDAKDRRSQRVLLTEKAHDFSKNNEAGIQAFIQRLYKDVDEEDLLTTIQTLQTMERNIQ